MKTLLPKEGSKWSGTDCRDVFHVINTVEIDGHTWVYYIKDINKETNEIREYSCYVESFLQRFRPLPD